MIRVAGFAQGQTGDLVIQTVVARAFRQQFPGSQLTFAVAEKYRDILPLLIGNPNIHDFHVWESYNDWPNTIDLDYCKWRGFDAVFHAMPPHTRPDWYNHHHYAVENCLRFGLTPPSDLSYELVKWFPKRDGCERFVTLSLFPSKGTQLDKTMPIEECEKLCVGLKQMGYTPIQLGGRFEVKLENALAPSLSILEAAQVLTSSAFHISADTAFCSIASGYKHPTIGFYGLNYPDMVTCDSHLPPNPNALYIKNRAPQSLKAEDILSLIPTLLVSQKS